MLVGAFALFDSGVPAPTDVALAKGGISALVGDSKLVRASKSIANSHTDCPSQRTSTISGCPATSPYQCDLTTFGQENHRSMALSSHSPLRFLV